MNSSLYVRLGAMIICFVIALPFAGAVIPPPDGGYPNQNTAEGEDALFNLTTGADNTAVGYHALHDITNSGGNTAIGYEALAVATAGPNTAIGSEALSSNTTGFNNTAVDGLYTNTTGHDNTSVGFSSLTYNRTGSYNTAMGVGANEDGNGSYNCAIGSDAMQLGSGSGNVAVGVNALAAGFGNRNVVVGFDAGMRAAGTGNIIIGAEAGQNLSADYGNNIYIGNPGAAKESGTIRIGEARNETSTYIAGISGVTVADGVEVVIGPNGQLGTLNSSARYKEAIKPMGDASAPLLDLQPVSFRYKKTLDPAATPQFGLVAEQVEKVDPDLVAYDEGGKPYSVRYEAVNAMLLNEFLKEHRKAEERCAMIESQKRQLEQLQAAVKKLENALQAQTDEMQKLLSQSSAHHATN